MIFTTKVLSKVTIECWPDWGFEPRTTEFQSEVLATELLGREFDLY